MLLNAPLRQAFQPKVLQSGLLARLNGIQNYAGLVASFDASNGALLPLPDFYIPPALKEWGQVPTVLEVLTSSKGNTPNDRLQTIVLPETGCGIDNLETIMTKETLKTIAFQGGGLSDPVAALVKNSRSSTFEYFEAIFPHEIAEDETGSKYRCRVSVLIGANSKAIKLVVERFVEEVESNKMVADTAGGGLDGQTVARWLGSQLSSVKWKAFAENTCPSQASKCSLNLPLGVIVQIEAQRLIISKSGNAETRVALDSNTLTLQDVSSVVKA